MFGHLVPVSSRDGNIFYIVESLRVSSVSVLHSVQCNNFNANDKDFEHLKYLHVVQ